MSRIVVVGGSGRTGRALVEKLIKNRDEVVATIRNPKYTASLEKVGAEVALLDLETSSPGAFAKAFEGADAVVFTAGSSASESSEIDRKGVLKTIRAAEKAGVKRYVTIASIGASTSIPEKYRTELKDYYAAKRAANKALRASRLDWTIVEPGELTDGRSTGRIAISEDEIEDKPISRADVAATIVAILHEPRSVGRTYQLVGGGKGIRQALGGMVGD